MNISCDCGKFKASLTAFPKNSPGRLVCYCLACRTYLEKINRKDLLDEYGGTEIIPAYPNEIEITRGKDLLKCNCLKKTGTYRWTTTCCNSPIANTKGVFPWAGIVYSAYTNEDSAALEKLGVVRCRVFGRDALKNAPSNISNSIKLKDLLVVIPFVVKGKILRKGYNSPFLGSDNATPISSPEVLK